VSVVRVGAVDLGASSGRVVVADIGPDRLVTREVGRFPNGPVRLGDTLHWDILALYRGLLDGLRAAGPLDAVGIDSWGVDYGLLDATGALLGNPVHHRDARTDGVAGRVQATIPAPQLYAATGVQVLPINTIYQLVAAAGTPQLAAASDLLMIPDLLGYWLTGERRAEVTNASTTGLLDARERDWATGIMTRAGIDADLVAPLVEPGERIGELAPHVLAETGLPGAVPVVAVGSHDTASAVVGVPAQGERFAYISCGTWSLVGVELAAPVLTEESRAANFSNELGVDGTVRYLRNVMGLWLLQECLRAWPDADLGELLAVAARVPAFTAVIDADDPAFLPPGDMPGRIADACRRAGQEPPRDRAETVRCVLDSLALAHRRTVRDAVALSDREVDVVHVVGGGARNALLCQLTADACGLPVVAGPTEATALGNLVVQARAYGVVNSRAEGRALVRRTHRLRRFEPVDHERWLPYLSH
jgi:rhamnulokinase